MAGNTQGRRSDYGANPETLKRLLDKRGQELADREATIAALTQRFGVTPDPTLEKLAQALKLAKVATNPSPPPQLWDKPPSKNAETSMPGEHLQSAARAEQVLRRRVLQAVDDYFKSAENGWRNMREPEPKVRCTSRACGFKDVRIPKFLRAGRGLSSIEQVTCQGCGGRLSDG